MVFKLLGYFSLSLLFLFFLFFSLACNSHFSSKALYQWPLPASGNVTRQLHLFIKCQAFIRRCLVRETFPAIKNQFQPNQIHVGVSHRKACQHGKGLRSTESPDGGVTGQKLGYGDLWVCGSQPKTSQGKSFRKPERWLSCWGRLSGCTLGGLGRRGERIENSRTEQLESEGKFVLQTSVIFCLMPRSLSQVGAEGETAPFTHLEKKIWCQSFH